MSEKLQADWDREIEERMAHYESKAKDAALWEKIKEVVPKPEGLEGLVESIKAALVATPEAQRVFLQGEFRMHIRACGIKVE